MNTYVPLVALAFRIHHEQQRAGLWEIFVKEERDRYIALERAELLLPKRKPFGGEL